MRRACALVLVLVTGCSSLMVRAPRRDPGTRPVACDESMAWPTLDMVGAVSVAGVGTGAFLIATETGDGDPLAIMSLFGVFTTAYIISSGIGFASAKRCRGYNRAPLPPDPQLEARKRAQAEAWQLTKQAAMAARVGDCASTQILDQRVRALDVEFHAVVFARDAAIARCAAPSP
jgi:hypothetical protein